MVVWSALPCSKAANILSFMKLQMLKTAYFKINESCMVPVIVYHSNSLFCSAENQILYMCHTFSNRVHSNLVNDKNLFIKST